MIRMKKLNHHRSREACRLADLRAAVVAAVLRSRSRADAMLPDELSPFEVEVLAAGDELLDEVRRLFDAAVAEVQTS